MYTQAHYAQHVYSSPNILNNYEFLPQLRWESKLWAPQNFNPDIDIWNYLWRDVLTRPYAFRSDNTRCITNLPTDNTSNYYSSHNKTQLVHATNKQTAVYHRCRIRLPVSWTHVLSLPAGTSVSCCSAVLATPGAGASAQYRKLRGVTQHCSLADL
jgi:hypothetical protein